MSVHSRRAAKAVLDALEAVRDAGRPIMHWFSGTQRELARAVDIGCWFSVGPTMLGTDRGRAVAAKIPWNRLLTESDGPFAQVGGRNALPWDAGTAEIALAEVWDVPLDEVQARLTGNLRTLVDDA